MFIFVIDPIVVLDDGAEGSESEQGYDEGQPVKNINQEHLTPP
jgi:hypothetical protein